MPVNRIVRSRRERSPSIRTGVVAPSATKVVRADQNMHVGPAVPGTHGPLEAARAACGRIARAVRARRRGARRRIDLEIGQLVDKLEAPGGCAAVRATVGGLAA